MPLGTPGAPAPGAPGAPRPAPRSRSGIAWAVILGLVAGVAALQAFRRDAEPLGNAFTLRVMEQQVRMQYGMREWMRSLGGPALPGSASDLEMLRQALGKGPPAVRLRFAVVAGDMAGPAAAREELDRLDRLLRERSRSLEGDEAEAARTLRALYAGGGPSHSPEAVEAIPEGRRDLLRRELGWFGRLALAPEGSPDRKAVLGGTVRLALALMGAGLGGCLLLGAGFLAAIVYWLRVGARGAAFRFAQGPTPPGVYAETFALWLAGFLLLSLGARAVQEAFPGSAVRTASLFAVPVLSLGALAWPARRGVPWERVKEDLGLRLSATPVRDALAGIGCWILGLPVLAFVGAATFAVLAVLGAGRPEGDPLETPAVPGHPVVDDIAEGFPWVLVLLLAAVLAPIVEETFFRGVLYRHLRDATGRAGRAASILLSAGVSGLVFGAIHPQGLLFVPLLAAVAWPMVHAREWRDSLVAPMAAHAWHNALVTLFAWTLLAR